MKGYRPSYEECSPEVQEKMDARQSYLEAWQGSGLSANAYWEAHPRGDLWAKSTFYKWVEKWLAAEGNSDVHLKFEKCCGPIQGKAVSWGAWTKREIVLALDLLGLSKVDLAKEIGANENTVQALFSGKRESGPEAQRIAVDTCRYVVAALGAFLAAKP